MARTAWIAKAVAASLFVLVSACSGNSGDASHEITPGFVRAPSPGAIATGGYLTIEAKGADRLIGARSDAADVEIHTMEMQDGVMVMRPVEAIAFNAGDTVELKPGGYHLMLINPDTSLAQGTDAEITLLFENAGEITVTLPVQQR